MSQPLSGKDLLKRRRGLALRIMLVGAVVSLAILSLQWARYTIAKVRLGSLIADCQKSANDWVTVRREPSVRSPTSGPLRGRVNPNDVSHFVPFSDVPAGTNDPFAAAVACEGLRNLEDDFWLPAIGAMVLFSLPWLWYFLLARIEELSAAIRHD